MKIFALFLLSLFLGSNVYSSVKADSILNVLKKELARKNIYDDQKIARIKKLKETLHSTSKTDYNLQYNLCSKLYEEYKVYQFDSAYVYTQKLLNISKLTNNASRQHDSRIKLGFILLSSGMFKETFDCLNQIDARLLNDTSRLEYYTIKTRAYSDLSEYNSDNNYALFDKKEAIKYADSAIALCRPNSFEMLYNLGNKQVVSGDFKQPSPYFIQLLTKFKITEHQRAMVATGLSLFYNKPEQAAERRYLITVGAINDIRSSTKETTAIFKLGQQLYAEGNLKDAYSFIQQAMEDAQFYGARLRKINIGAVLPLVAAQKIITTENEKNRMENEKNRFLIYLLFIAVIAILITLVSFIVFIQLKRLKAKEKIIEEKNAQLEKINDKLNEDTHIKEEYIGYFFNVISGYILKLEKLKRSVERKLATKKYEDILISMNEINIKKERETLFYTFDHVFLKIFPNFISAFNSLLKKEDQIWPKDNEVLNTDLRIFALMRLGINDNETIANILEYSVNTIYVYKMRIKAKATVPSDQFDQKIMSIKAVELLNRS
ncbi:MAG: DUF6377 domain-containing protein [Mucilaginibacter sp.]